MTDDIDERLLIAPPPDPQVDDRVKRLRELGIGDIPDEEFDAFARKVAEKTGAPFAFVNFIDGRRQYFAGMHTPDGAPADESGRTMPRDRGWCVHVVHRRKPLVLEDMRDFARFHSDPVVDELGFHTYLGAPLIDHTGILLGTVAVTDLAPRRWGQPGLKLIKELAAELVAMIEERELRNRVALSDN